MKEGDLFCDKSKRGMSTVVASLIIILLVLVATGIVWAVVRDLVRTNSEEVSLGKFTTSFEIESVKATDTNLNVKVRRNAGEGDISGLKFIVFDGTNNHIFDFYDVDLKVLESRTFVLDYTGEVRRVSLAPIFILSSGKESIGDVADTYYSVQYVSGDSGEGCTPQCSGKECGFDGCTSVCGICGEGLYCDEESWSCTEEPQEADCSLADETCVGENFPDGAGGICEGLLEPDCTGVTCGPSQNQCGGPNACNVCPDGYECFEGACQEICITSCGVGGRECGPDPAECQETCGSCEVLYGEGYYCNEGTCTTDPCEDQCGERQCGPDPAQCVSSCGTCNTGIGEYCSSEGMCVTEEFVNTGTVYSVWPSDPAIYFDSEDLPKSGVDYTNYYAKFTTGLEDRCLQIREFVTPVFPEVYNLSHIRFVSSSTEVRAGDVYQIWESFVGCDNG